jgi:integrase/recombinase XerD
LSTELVRTPADTDIEPLPIPAVAIAVLDRTPNATFAADEFFKASISNEHTQRAYCRIVGRFLIWCDGRRLDLRNITPGVAGEYFGRIEGSEPTKNQGLAALRKFFDALVQRHAVDLNPFASVAGIKYTVTEGKTAELSIEQAHKLLHSIKTRHVVGLRDRAVLGVLAYTGARVGAVAKLRLCDYRNLGEHRMLRFKEKNGKDREIPVRHDLAAWLNEYMRAAGIPEDSKSKTPLFRAGDGKRRVLTPAPYGPHLMRQMMKRRLADAGLETLFSPHSFRVTVVTDLLNQNVPLEDVQYLAGHSSPTTTRVYDRRRRKVTRNIVERISI